MCFTRTPGFLGEVGNFFGSLQELFHWVDVVDAIVGGFQDLFSSLEDHWLPATAACFGIALCINAYKYKISRQQLEKKDIELLNKDEESLEKVMAMESELQEKDDHFQVLRMQFEKKDEENLEKVMAMESELQEKDDHRQVLRMQVEEKEIELLNKDEECREKILAVKSQLQEKEDHNKVLRMQLVEKDNELLKKTNQISVLRKQFAKVSCEKSKLAIKMGLKKLDFKELSTEKKKLAKNMSQVEEELSNERNLKNELIRNLSSVKTSYEDKINSQQKVIDQHMGDKIILETELEKTEGALNATQKELDQYFIQKENYEKMFHQQQQELAEVKTFYKQLVSEMKKERKVAMEEKEDQFRNLWNELTEANAQLALMMKEKENVTPPPPGPKELALEKNKEAMSLMKVNDFAGAIELCNAALELDLDSSTFEMRAGCYYALREYDLALQDAKRAMEADPSPVSLSRYSLVAECLVTLGNPNEALDILQRGNAVLGGDAPCPIAQRLSKRAQQLAMWTEKANSLLETGEFTQALEFYEKAAKIAVGCTYIRVRKAECLALLKKYVDAEKLINKILKEDSQNGDALYVRGKCHYLKGNFTQATKVFAKALEFSPSHKKALQAYKQVNQEIKIMAGQQAILKGDFEAALIAFDEAEKLGSFTQQADIDLYHFRALVKVALLKYAEASKDCTRVIDLSENHTAAYYMRGFCRVSLGKYKDAVDDYQFLVSLFPRKYQTDLDYALQIERFSETPKYYDILGVAKNCQVEDIKKAYRKMVLIHHTDKLGSTDADIISENRDRIQMINVAKDVLMDQSDRAAYDQQLQYFVDLRHEFLSRSSLKLR